LQKSVLHALVHLHDSRGVAASVAVVRCAEYGDNIPVVAPVVTFHDELVRSGDKLEAINVVEAFRGVLPEGKTCTAGRDPPPDLGAMDRKVRP